MKNLKTLFALLFLFLGSSIYASDLEIIPYQGSIANSAGTPYSGSFDFSFEIQNNIGTVIWNSGTMSLDVNLGAYSVLLGQTPSSPIPDTIWKNYDSLYLEISFNDGVNGMESLSPLVEFLPVPRSITAKYAEHFCGDSIDLETITSLISLSNQTVTDTINTEFIHVNNLALPGNEFLELEKALLRLNCPNGTFTTTKTPEGGELVAVDIPTGNEMKIQLFAEELLAKFIGGPLVLPNPASNEEATLESDKLVFENDLLVARQALEALGGSHKVTEKASGTSVETKHDPINELIKFITGNGIVVLPNPTSNEEATLKEDKLELKNQTQTMEQKLDLLFGSTKVTETATGDDVEQQLDAINDAIRFLSEKTEHSNGGNLGLEQVIDDVNQVILRAYHDGPKNITEVFDPAAGIKVNEGVVEDIQLDGSGMALINALDSALGTAQIVATNGVNNVGFQFDPGSQTTFHQGNMTIQGLLAKLAGSFKIDHPEDPYNKYLVHSFVESPDMMNIYNGNTTTNADGFATVEMPEYFESLNMNFRYQLTVIGDFAQAAIAEEIDNNRFKLMTDKPNVTVSWQVTGVRQDVFANENRIEAVVDKEDKMKGKLLYEPRQAYTVK